MTVTPIFILTAILLILAVGVWRSRSESPINRSFAGFTFAVAAWAFSITGTRVSEHTHVFVQMTFAAASLIPITFLYFAHHYPRPSSWPSRYILWTSSAVSAAFCILSFGTTFVASSATVVAGQLHRVPGPLYVPFAVYFLVTFGLGFLVLFRKWRNASGSVRRQLTFLGAGILVSGIGAITTNLLIPLLTGDSSFAIVGPYFGLSLIAFVAHAIIRHRSADFRLAIHHGLTLGASTLLSLTPVALLFLLLWPRLAPRIDTNELAVGLVAIAIAALLVPVTKDLIGRWIDNYVYRTIPDYRKTVTESSRFFTQQLNLPVLVSWLNAMVAKSLQCEAVVLYLRQNDTFIIFDAGTNIVPDGFAIPREMPKAIVESLCLGRTALAPFADRRRSRETQVSILGAEELGRLNWSLVLPVLSENNAIGAIVVGPKLSGDPFYPDDFDLLMTLANQAGIAIKNARLYAEVVLANEYIENIVATIESGVIGINPARQITIFNRAAEQLTGLSRDEMRMRSVEVLPECLGGVLSATVADGAARVQPEVMLTAGTVSRPVICTTSPLCDPGGATVGAVAVFSDLTPFKELEAERGRAERLRYLEVLAAGIAHEIKNPLVAIKTFAQLIPRRHSDGRFIDDFGRVVTREIGRMEQLLERLRTLARPAEQPRQLVDLRQPLGDSVEFLRPAFDDKHIGLALEVTDAPAIVWGEPDELEQLFINLIVNAREATPPGGQVSIEVVGDGEHVTVMVADTGPGIPPELLDRVFEPFFSTKQRGSGLGLAISSRIATAHGARLRAGNHAQGGAVFSLEFRARTLAEVPTTA